jgi:hypothetical protein
MDRITEAAPYGQHIDLRCKNHPELGAAWSTKNIAPIGSRRIFFDLLGVIRKPECACPLSTLEPV